MNLSELRRSAGRGKRPKRVGRGMGSGMGKTSTRGEKGQKSRAGYRRKRGFEGGQMPLIRRVPKRGFHNPFRKEYAIVNLSRLEALAGDTFNPDLLIERGVVKKLGAGLKILGGGEVSRALTVTAHCFTKSAKEKIEAAGGKADVLGG